MTAQTGDLGRLGAEGRSVQASSAPPLFAYRRRDFAKQQWKVRQAVLRASRAPVRTSCCVPVTATVSQSVGLSLDPSAPAHAPRARLPPFSARPFVAPGLPRQRRRAQARAGGPAQGAALLLNPAKRTDCRQLLPPVPSSLPGLRMTAVSDALCGVQTCNLSTLALARLAGGWHAARPHTHTNTQCSPQCHRLHAQVLSSVRRRPKKP